MAVSAKTLQLPLRSSATTVLLCWHSSVQILFVRRYGQHADPFLEQGDGIARTRCTPDGAFFGISIVDFARFFREALSNVLGLFRMLPQCLQHLLQLCRSGCVCCRGQLLCSDRLCSRSVRASDVRCRRQTPHFGSPAGWAGEKAARRLRFDVFMRREPPFETMLVGADQINDYHFGIYSLLEPWEHRTYGAEPVRSTACNILRKPLTIP